MLKCEHCESGDVRWFTPTRAADQAAVLLCMACQKVTIVPPRFTYQVRLVNSLRSAA
jgi:hypothetical protein